MLTAICHDEDMTEAPTGTEDERDIAWRMAVELQNRPTWPTPMWNGSPVDAARQLSEFGDSIVELAKPARGHAAFVLERAIQLVRSATVCANLVDARNTARIRSQDRARALCDAIAPFAAVADRVLNDVVDQYGFRSLLTPSSAQLRSVPVGHEEFTPNALRDRIQVVVYWSDDHHRSRCTRT
jgi:hypothetical protein